MASFWRRVCVVVLLTLLFASVFMHPARAHGGDDHDEDADEDSDAEGESHAILSQRNRGLILVKVYCLIIIFFATFIPGVSPYYLRWNNTFLVLGIQFAAGVFLATALLHFLGDANETFETLTPKAYPFAEMLAVSGYLLTMFADVLIQSVYNRQNRGTKSRSDVENNDGDDGKSQTDKKSCCGKNSAACVCPEPPQTLDSQNVVKATLIEKATFGDALLLIFALCFHSVFEGLAIGVAETKYDAWRNLWTISLHKVFAAIAMGIALLRMVPNRPLLSCALYAFLFAISSPIGVAIGIAIDSNTQGSTADWIYAIAMGLATGVFIYVAINHLLAQRAFTADRKLKLNTPFFRFLAVTLGCGVIFVVLIWD